MKYVRISRNFMHARYHVMHLEPDVVGDVNHLQERARSPKRASQKPEGDARGAGNNDTLYSILVVSIGLLLPVLRLAGLAAVGD